MKNHLIFSLFVVLILTLCGCTVDFASGQLSARAETPKNLAFGNLGHGSDMVYVEGGTFQMGGTGYDNEKPVHTVTVSSFYMGKYEVTQAEYQKIMGSNPSGFKGDQRPVECVTWYDAVKYCNKRSEAEKLTSCYTIEEDDVTCNWSANGYRLPTEAEWEYAARGGKYKSAFEYSGSDNIDEVAWYGGSKSGKTTHEVGKKKANALGIYDMSGNVWEWCWDRYGSNYYKNSPGNNPLGPVFFGDGRVLRGGGWSVDAGRCRCARRGNRGPGSRGDDWGFRVVRSGGAIAPKNIVYVEQKQLLKRNAAMVKETPKNMVYVEGGTFQMGGTKYDWEKPAHEVTVSSFYMSKYEVTQAEYEKIMGENPSCFKGERRPVESVTWYDTVNYCNKRSEAEGLTSCYTINSGNVTCNWSANGYRLPTEAEWEYAARGGKHKSAFEYSGSDSIDEVAWYSGNSGNQTHEVGKKKANALGIYDMSGNVWEWCWDRYSKDYYKNNPANNPLGPASGSYRVFRGGGWGYNASNCRCAFRYYYDPSYRYDFIGFRVVRSGGASAPKNIVHVEQKQLLKRNATMAKETPKNMVLVEGGTFQMGGTSKVTVNSFYMGKYQVTQAEYQKIMGNNPSYFKGDKLPVEEVSWYDAVNYCNRRSKAEKLTPCYTINGDNVTCNWNANGYRLPTEAEWEYAARGGKHKSTYKYSGSDNIDEVAWYDDNSGNATHEVGKKNANALGLYDMSGNVYEWCWDWYGKDYYGSSLANNPLGPASGGGRVIRGGGWYYSAVNCRSAYRYYSRPDARNNRWGFRVVRSGGAIAPKNMVYVEQKQLLKRNAAMVKEVPKNMVYVEGGTFQMGSAECAAEWPAHRVTVSSFYMGKYQVTQAEYQKIMGTNPSHFKGEQRPVECVSWYDAVNYCNRRSEAESLTPCYTIDDWPDDDDWPDNVTCDWNANGYRLPTEAEWEYAARGGIHKSAFEYSGSDDIDEVAWNPGNSGSHTHKVGKKKANALGIYDMSGNVWEWCWDWYDNDYYSNSPANNPLGPASGDGRVIRGGCWSFWGFSADDCRCASRFRGFPFPGRRSISSGFRVVRSCK